MLLYLTILIILMALPLLLSILMLPLCDRLLKDNYYKDFFKGWVLVSGARYTLRNVNRMFKSR